MTRLGSLFTGYGGLDMAVGTVLGCEVAWVCDNDPAAATLLAHRYPDVPNLGDITTVQWDQVEPVDVLAGGFPCQDISNAGRRAGIEGERSGLWSYFADAIGALRPRYVLVENVAALLVRGFDTVAADLAGLGYHFAWCVLGAGDTGAPHRRNRLFLAATWDTAGEGRGEGPTGRGLQPQELGARRVVAPHSAHDGHQRPGHPRDGRPGPARDGAPAAHSGCDARQEDHPHEPTAARSGRAASDSAGDGRHEPARHERGSDAAERGAPLADAERQPVRQQPDELPRCGGAGLPGQPGAETRWGPYEPAIRRWEHVLGRPAPAPTVTGARGGRVLNPELPEWMMGLPAGWITAVPGLSRSQQLKLAGNGVVPQQAAAAFRYLLPLLESDRSAA